MKLKSLFLAILFGFSILIALPLIAMAINNHLLLPVLMDPGLDVLGIILMVVGVLIHLPSAYIFRIIGKGTPVPVEPPKKLVIVGLYKLVRNPMYIGLFLIILGGFFIFGHVFLLVYALMFLAAFHLYVVFVEEPRLKQRFGQVYIDYVKSVPRWIPKI